MSLWGSQSGPSFYAWCDATDRFDALAAALYALVCPGGRCRVELWTLGLSEKLWRRDALVDDVIATTRLAHTRGTWVDVSFDGRWRCLARMGLYLECFGDEYARRSHQGPLRAGTGERKDVFPGGLAIAAGGGRLEIDASRSRDERPIHAGAIRRGPRARLPDDTDLTREQVLAALSTPKATLLEALEAAAVSEEAWRAVEPLAREIIEATNEGVPTCEVAITGKHTRFIERHAPHHVRRAPNGGVLLATHPYRTVWPLWAGALHVLRIAP